MNGATLPRLGEGGASGSRGRERNSATGQGRAAGVSMGTLPRTSQGVVAENRLAIHGSDCQLKPEFWGGDQGAEFKLL